MRRLALIALVFMAPSLWAASLPTPDLACNAGAVDETTCDASSAGTLTITKPTMVVAGDLMVATCFNLDGATDLSMSGWTEYDSEVTSGSIRMSPFYKTAGDAEPATYTLTITGGGTAAASGCKVGAFHSIAQSSPLDTSGSTTGTGTSITLPSLTTGADNALLYYSCIAAAGSPTYTPPGGYVEESDASGASHGTGLQASAGATGTKTVTLSTSQTYACYHSAFKYNTAGTRVYLPSTGSPAVTPTYDAGWEDTGSAARLAAVFTRGSTAMSTVTISEGTGITTAGQDLLGRQYSIQVGAQTISGVIQCNLRFAESATGNNGHTQINVWRANSSGTFQDSLLGFQGNTASGNPTDELTTSLHAWNDPRKGDTHTLTSRTASNNDYVVIELGVREHNATSTAVSYTMRIGDTAATPLDRDDAETTDNHPWCDFLGGLAAPSASSCSTSIALLGVGCR